MTKLKRQLETIQDKIQRSALSVGKNSDDITLIAVSKTYPVEAVLEAHALGCNHFGENKVQELMGKLDVIHEKLNWHLIGHLQTNKVKYIVGKVALIHSVDSLKLIQEIQKQSMKNDVITEVLLEVNVGEELSKDGFLCEELMAVIHQIADLTHVKVKGLMTVAPYVENPEENRPIFRKLFNLSVDIQKQNIDNIDNEILSMGMSNDYEVAIQEGANMVRIGTALFGERDYT